MEQGILNKNEISLSEVMLKLRGWLKFMFSKWKIFLVAAIIGVLIGIGSTYVIKPKYTASSTFVLEDGDSPGGGLSQYAGIASMVGIDIGGDGGGLFQGDNIIELYKSRNMIRTTLLSNINGQKELLIDRYIQYKDWRSKWEKDIKLKNIDFRVEPGKSFTRLQDSILGKAIDDISQNSLVVGKPDKKLSIIKVDIESPDELFSKEFDNRIVENVNDFYIQTKTKRSLANIKILQQKTDSVRNVLNGAIYSAAAASDATPNLNPTRQIQRIVPVQRSQATAETNKLILGELIKNLELSKISLSKETPLIQIIDQPGYPLKVSKVGFTKGIFFGIVVLEILVLLFLTIKYIANDQGN